MLPRMLPSGLAAALLFLAPLLAACAQTAPPEAAPPPAAIPYAFPADTSAAPMTAQGRMVVVRFDAGSSELNAAARASLTPVVEQLRADPRAVATITSYAERMEFEAARARAAAVRRVLTGQGVTARRIRVVNAGMTASADPRVVQVQVR